MFGYLTPSTGEGGEEKSKEDKMTINKDIEDLMDYTQEFNSMENAKSKIDFYSKKLKPLIKTSRIL